MFLQIILCNTASPVLTRNFIVRHLANQDRDRPHLRIIAALIDETSVAEALNRIRPDHGRRIASIVHLAAFFDFSGEDKPQYKTVM